MRHVLRLFVALFVAGLALAPIPLSAQPAVGPAGTSAKALPALTDDGQKVTTSEPLDLVDQYLGIRRANEAGIGTTQFKIAKLTGAGTAIVATTADTDGFIGIVQLGAGTSGTALIAQIGSAQCIFDGPTTQNNWVVASTSAGGQCHDAGSSRPNSIKTVGRVLSTNGSGGTYLVLLDPGLSGAGAAGSVPAGVDGDIQTKNGANFSNLGIGSALQAVANILNVKLNGITLAMHAQAGANKLLGNATGGTANIAEISAPGCTDTNGQHWNYTAGTGLNCGNSVRFGPNLYIGAPTTHNGNDYTLLSLTPADPAFALTNGFTIRTVFDNDNTGPSRLNAAGTGLTPIQLNTSGGFTPLKGGEVQNGLIADLVYNSTCTCFVLLNTPANATVFNATTNTITAKQFGSGTIFVVSVAGQTLTMPVSTTLSPNGGSLIAAVGGSVTLTSTAPDQIVCGLTTLAAGASATIPQGTLAFLGTNATGQLALSPGTCNGAVLVTPPPAGGTGQTTYTDGQLLIGNTATGSLSKATITAGANCTVTNGNGSITINCTAAGGSGTVNAPQGRLTLTSGAPVMIADNTGTSTIYYDNYRGNAVPYYTGAADSSDTITAGEVSDVVPTSGTGVANASDLFDEYWSHSGATICHVTNGSGGGWSSDTAGSTTARGTGYSQLDLTGRPYITNKNALTHCYNGATDKGSIAANQAPYLGTFYTTGAGQTKMQFTPAAAAGGSNAFLGLYNAYNNERTITSRSLDSNDWNVAGISSWQSADSSTAYRITYVDGNATVGLSAVYSQTVNDVAGTCIANIGINRDSTSATPTMDGTAIVTTGDYLHVSAPANFLPSSGLHNIQAVERSAGSSSTCGFHGGDSSLVASFSGM